MTKETGEAADALCRRLLRKDEETSMNSIICGDALEVLQAYDDNVFDAIVCDPPCGISFMSAKWDSNKGGRDQWIAWLASIMREALRTLKPGGHCLVWALPRTSHWTATALEDAGFEIRDVVHHMYSADTALQGFLASLTTEQREAFERLIDGQGSSVMYALFGSGFPKSLSVDKAIDAYFNAEREVLYQGPELTTGDVYNKGINANFAQRTITAPATDAPRRWQGYGTALKPSAEHWILCRKPLSERSIAENVLQWGCGALNIDASRIGTENTQQRRKPSGKRSVNAAFASDNAEYTTGSASGRFPAHLVLSHAHACTDEQCVDGCPVLALDRQSGTRKSGGRLHQLNEGYDSFEHSPRTRKSEHCTAPSTGTASRYFAQFRPDDVPPFYYASKASRRERNAGLDGLNASAVHRYGAGIGEGKTPDAPVVEKNHHPTVKSLSLMRYLVKLVTQPNGVVLDMFCGSGSTLCAAIYEHCRFVGIDQSEEYCAIAKARVAYAREQILSCCAQPACDKTGKDKSNFQVDLPPRQSQTLEKGACDERG